MCCCCKEFCPHDCKKALAYSALIWIIGLAWGTAVFMTPGLKNWPTVPWISQYPAISLPLLVAGPAILYFLSKEYLKDAKDAEKDGLRLGATIAFSNLALDALVYLVLFQSWNFFSYATIWVSYALFLTMPWYIGKKMQAGKTR